MVIFYDKTTKDIHHTEDNVMVPTIPEVQSAGEQAIADKRAILAERNLDFVAMPYEFGGYIFNFKLCFDNTDNFVGIQPI